MSASSGDSLNPLRSHYRRLYSQQPPPYAEALEQILPDSLKHPSVLNLHSTAFISVESLNRLIKITTEHAQTCDSTNNIVLADIGCGRGNVGRFIGQQLDAKVIGLDWSIAFSPNGVNKEGIICADICALPIKDEIAEIAIALDSIYLAHNALAALRECRRILTSSGLLILSLYDRPGPGSPARDNLWWNKAFSDSGLIVKQWLDVSDEWRTMMRAKHANRLRSETVLRKKFGDAIVPELEVSKRMLGDSTTIGFLDTCNRWEIVLTVRR